MKNNFESVMKWVGTSEGGYVNHPRDPGGATDRGITQRTYDAWQDSQRQPRRPVKGIGKGTAEAILKQQYFDTVSFDELPSGLDYAVVDYAINSGPGKAVKELQQIVGVTADGVMGLLTLAAIGRRDTTKLIIALCEQRMRFLRRLATWSTFGRGWTTRVMGKEPGVQSGDIGVIDRAVRLGNGQTNIPAPTVQETAKAPPPAPPETVLEDGASKGTAVGFGGAIVAGGGVLSALGDLDTTAQLVAIGGLLVALLAMAWVFRARIRSMAQ